MKRSSTIMTPACALSIAACVGFPAMAQENAPANSDTPQIETIVVTAQKYSQLLSKAPVAISTIGQEGIDKLNAVTPQDLVSSVPNLQTSVNGYATQFQIRGIGNNSGSYSVVATQIDGIYEASPLALNAGMYDVSRVEVARGPQGTVYGRNATAGVVNILTHDPTDELQIFGDLAYGNHNDLTTRAVVNVPVTDGLAVRGSFVRETNDGYYPRGAAPRNYAAKDLLSGQLTIMANLGDRLTWRLAVEHSENTGTLNYLHAAKYLYYPGANLATVVLGSPVAVPARDNLFNQESVTDNAIRTQENALRSRLTWNATDEFTITYLAGLSSTIDNGTTAATGVFWAFNRGSNTRATSHELDFNYDTDRIKAVAGLYFYWDNQTGNTGLHIGNTVPYPLNTFITAVTPPFQPLLNNPVGFESASYGLIDLALQNAKNGNQSEAAFAQVTYNVLDALRLTGGIRYTQDWHNIDAFQSVCMWNTVIVTSTNSSCGVTFVPRSESYQATKSNNTSFRLGADYDLTQDQLIYASVSTGYRAGGVSGNALLPVQYQSYKPETVTNYEAGWKGQLVEHTLNLSLTAFLMDYKGMQVSAIEHDILNNPTPVTINAARARIKGLEFEWEWRITSADTLSGFVTYLDARFSSFPNAVDPTTNPDGIYNNNAPGLGFALLPTNVPYNFTGHYLPNAPQESLRVSYSHVFDLGDSGTFTPSIQVYWQDAMYSDFANNPLGAFKPYTRSDLNLTYESRSSRWTVNAYVHNLENRAIWQVLNAKWDNTQGLLFPPRTYGLRVGYKLY